MDWGFMDHRAYGSWVMEGCYRGGIRFRVYIHSPDLIRCPFSQGCSLYKLLEGP